MAISMDCYTDKRDGNGEKMRQDGKKNKKRKKERKKRIASELGVRMPNVFASAKSCSSQT